MAIAVVFIITLFSLYFSFRYYKSFFNPVVIYVIPWSIICFFYELKLIRFVPISTEAWLVILFGYLSFIAGLVLTNVVLGYSHKVNTITFFDDKNGKIIYNVILITGILSIIISLLNWKYLINKFGSITNIFLQANRIYQMRVDGELPEAVPYVYLVSYVGVYFSGIYTALTKRVNIIVILPFLGVILKDIANFGRVGILLAVLLFIFTFFLSNKWFTGSKYFNLKENKKIITVFIIVLVLSIFGASLIKSTRGAFEHFKGTNVKLANLSKNFLISPSVYFYFSSHIGVLSKYLENPIPNTSFGSNTFLPIYNFLSKFELVEKKSVYQKGYFIPQWSNTGTYLRELHEDFGYVGIFLVPFIIGFLISYLSYRFENNPNLYNLLLLVYLYLIVAFTWLMMITRLAHWLLGLLFNLAAIGILKKLSSRQRAHDQKQE